MLLADILALRLSFPNFDTRLYEPGGGESFPLPPVVSKSLEPLLILNPFLLGL